MVCKRRHRVNFRVLKGFESSKVFERSKLERLWEIEARKALRHRKAESSETSCINRVAIIECLDREEGKNEHLASSQRMRNSAFAT
jgi:hypothetical protein